MMQYDPHQHHRRSIRLSGYDYRRSGAYFITINTYKHVWIFGEITEGKMQLNQIGLIVADQWRIIPHNFPHVVLDAWVIMPNHIHGIVVINNYTGDVNSENGNNIGNADFNNDDDDNIDGNDGIVGIAGIAGSRGEAFSLQDYIPCENASPLLQRMPEQLLNRSLNQSLNHTPQQSFHQMPSRSYARPVGTKSGSLGAILQNFKSITARRINQFRRTPGATLWQRNYWEHIIRNEQELNRIRQYITYNPVNWENERKNKRR